MILFNFISFDDEEILSIKNKRVLFQRCLDLNAAQFAFVKSCIKYVVVGGGGYSVLFYIELV